MRVLHVAAEIFPWVKTGGLGDVMAALPPALVAIGVDARWLVPGYPAVLRALHDSGSVAVAADCGPAFGALRVRLLRGTLADAASGVAMPAYVVDAPYFYVRDGGPYQDRQWRTWSDNAQRFGLLSWLAAQLAAGCADPQWSPQIVHAHDWHAALACAWLHEAKPMGVASVFTVHNLAYQGMTSLQDAPLLNLGAHWLTPSGLEFHGQLNMLKAGLAFADVLTTVSPTYAREITTTEFGCGMEGVINGRANVPVGILNGIDHRLWDPLMDPALAARYSAADPAGKAVCRAALRQECGITADASAPVMAVVSRLTSQKGLDLLLGALPALLAQGLSLVVQGSGDSALEAALRRMQQQHPGQVSVFTDFDEPRAHRIVAGADLIAVPSRFEPCGLTQLYGLRYGTVPVVRRVGGLADTVTDSTASAVASGHATGFSFDAASPSAFQAAVERALGLWRDQPAWQRLMRTGMAQDHSWARPAADYVALYGRALAAMPA